MASKINQDIVKTNTATKMQNDRVVKNTTKNTIKGSITEKI